MRELPSRKVILKAENGFQATFFSYLPTRIAVNDSFVSRDDDRFPERKLSKITLCSDPRSWNMQTVAHIAGVRA